MSWTLLGFGFANAFSENPASAVFIDETHEMTFIKDMALQAHHDISKDTLEILALYMPFRATMNHNWKKIREPNDEYINMKDFGSISIQEQEGMVQSIVTKLRGSQRDVAFPLNWREGNTFIKSLQVQKHQNRFRKGCSKLSKLVKNTCKAIHRSTQMKRIVSKESQYPGRKFMSSSHTTEKKRALRKRTKSKSIPYNV